MSENIECESRETAFQRRLQTFAIINKNHTDLQEFLRDAFHYFNEKIVQVLETFNMVKVSACLAAEFEKTVQKDDGGSATEKQAIFIHTKSDIIDPNMDLREFYDEYVIGVVMKQFDDVITKGSGFSLSAINELTIQINKYQPLNGSSYIPLPKYLLKKRAIINVKNEDEMCFKWAVLSALFPTAGNSHRVTSYYQYEEELDFTGIQFPMKISAIGKFEKMNDSISINVYHFDTKTKNVYPLRLTKHVKSKHIHLLLLTETDSDETGGSNGSEFFDVCEDGDFDEILDIPRRSHYCWIKNLSGLLTS